MEVVTMLTDEQEKALRRIGKECFLAGVEAASEEEEPDFMETLIGNEILEFFYSFVDDENQAREEGKELLAMFKRHLTPERHRQFLEMANRLGVKPWEAARNATELFIETAETKGRES